MNLWSEIGKIFGKRPSGETAKSRLQLLLVHDRAGLEGGRLEQLRRELVAVLARYVDVDQEAVEIEVHREAGLSALVVNSPLRV
jgi:cell division topological specificity factor